jgi:precorrin-6B methylase 2
MRLTLAARTSMAATALTARIGEMIRQQMAQWTGHPDMNQLYNLLRLLARWRSQVLVNTPISQEGAKITGGPFKGMDYVSAATEGPLIARLLGTYESELHPHLAALASGGIDCVIDVGCAEGYYAVGLARLMPEVTVYAYDIEEKARIICADLAARNGVGDRVIVGGELKPDGFQAFAGRKALVIVDTEGAEVDILQPDLSPALAEMNIIVETHDLFRAGARATLVERFTPTHDIVTVHQGQKVFDMPEWLKPLTHLDQLLAVWEWRMQPTPWLVMTPKRPAET